MRRFISPLLRNQALTTVRRLLDDLSVDPISASWFLRATAFQSSAYVMLNPRIRLLARNTGQCACVSATCLEATWPIFARI